MKKLTALILAFVMVFSMAACSADNDDENNTGASAATIVFTDDAGRDVKIPNEITKIIPSGSLSQIVLLAIAPDMFAGLSGSFSDKANGIIDERILNLPRFKDDNMNVEALALADPDIIIDIGDSKKGVSDRLDELQTRTEIPCVFLYATLETMPETYRTLGKLLGREERGEELALFCEKVYNRTIDIMNNVGDNKVDTLYVLGDKGLNVVAAGSYHAEVLDLLTNNLAVVDNPVSKGSGNEVTMEQILLWNPDFVIFAPDSIYDTVKDTPTWKEISAIINNRYIKVPDAPHNWMGMPPAVQRYLSLIWLTAQLYPDYCDYDVRADIREYYRLFYSFEMTDDMYNLITDGAFLR